MVCRELLFAMSTFFTYGLLLQTGAQYSAAGNTRACVEICSVLAEVPQVVPGRRRTSATLDVTSPATSSMCCRRKATNNIYIIKEKLETLSAMESYLPTSDRHAASWIISDGPSKQLGVVKLRYNALKLFFL